MVLGLGIPPQQPALVVAVAVVAVVAAVIGCQVSCRGTPYFFAAVMILFVHKICCGLVLPLIVILANMTPQSPPT